MRSCVYVDLDSLLDTRIGTLAKIDGKLAMETMLDLSYFQRDENVFKGVEKEVFKEEWTNRDKITLSLSFATMMCREIGRMVADLKMDDAEQPLRGEVRLTVNTYPYVLTEEEAKDVEDVLMHYIQDTCPVDVVRWPLENITPQMLKHDYVLLIMYDYGPWLEAQTDNFRKEQIPDTVLIAPKLWFQDKMTKEQLAEVYLDNFEDPLILTEMVSKGLVDLQLMDIKYWCAIPYIPEESSSS